MSNKFYCSTCNRIKKRYQVQATDCYYYTGYYCRYCHNETESINNMLIRLNKEIKSINRVSQLDDLHDWVGREAANRYSEHPEEKEAFKEGVYALLDKIGFNYKGEK